MRDRGKTIILSTHVMHEAERLCDFILLINKGKAVLNGTLDQIRSRRQSRAASVELEGQADFLHRLPMVAAVKPDGRRLEIVLTEGADPQELLKALAARVRVLAFEVKVPSLHEIFVHLVGTGNVQDS